MARHNDDSGAQRIGVFEARAGDEPILPSEFDVTDPRSSFFTDGREGVDRPATAATGARLTPAAHA